MGYLVVKVSTARGAIPLEDASVNIRGTGAESSDIIYSLTTNRDGLTEKVSLPAPPRAYSESPQDNVPYALYDIEVFKDGYQNLSFTNVAVFDSITSIQPAVMIPLRANRFPDAFSTESDNNPSDAEFSGTGR